MKMPLDSLLELAGKHARTVLVDIKMRGLMPTWLLINQTGNVMIVGTPWEDDADKERVHKHMRSHMRKLGVIAYSFITEAWTASVDIDEIDATGQGLKDPMRRPVHRGDRQEVVIACASTATETHWRQWRIVREPTTEIIVDLKLKAFPESDYQPQGWLADMLK